MGVTAVEKGTDNLIIDAVGKFFPKYAVTGTKNMTRESLVFSKMISFVRKCYVFELKTYCSYGTFSNQLKFSSKGPNVQSLEQSSDCVSEKYRKVLDDEVKFTSTKRGFRKKDHTVTTYERAKQRMS